MSETPPVETTGMRVVFWVWASVIAVGLAALHGLPPETWLDYNASPEFWNRTLQNWQSELLAVGAMVTFSIYLRQRGSSESKPVGAPHGESAVEGQ